MTKAQALIRMQPWVCCPASTFEQGEHGAGGETVSGDKSRIMGAGSRQRPFSWQLPEQIPPPRSPFSNKGFSFELNMA